MAVGIEIDVHDSNRNKGAPFRRVFRIKESKGFRLKDDVVIITNDNGTIVRWGENEESLLLREGSFVISRSENEDIFVINGRYSIEEIKGRFREMRG